jgi:hypothetical protein
MTEKRCAVMLQALAAWLADQEDQAKIRAHAAQEGAEHSYWVTKAGAFNEVLMHVQRIAKEFK